MSCSEFGGPRMLRCDVSGSCAVNLVKVAVNRMQCCDVPRLVDCPRLLERAMGA